MILKGNLASHKNQMPEIKNKHFPTPVCKEIK